MDEGGVRAQILQSLINRVTFFLRLRDAQALF